ncbi:MAG: ABC transporter ATP-binding protein [Gemmatimonadetes bacterium]|nr:ABC transporter ATP-binding protein [Gemmatimonadota bacterium]
MQRFRRLLGYLRPYRGWFAAGLIAALFASVLDGFTFTLLIPFLRLLFGAATAIPDAPTLVERVMHAVAAPLLGDGDARTALAAVTGLIVAVVLVKNMAVVMAGYLAVSIQESVARDLRVELYGHIQKLGLPFYQRTKGGQLLARVLSDSEQVRVGVSSALVSVLRNGALIVVYVGILFALSWRLALVTLPLAPSLALIMRPILKRVRARARDAAEARGVLAVVVAETVAGVRLVKTHTAEPYERRRFVEAARGHLRELLRAQRLAILASPLSETLGAVVIVLLLLIGMPGATGATMRPEVFVAFIAVTLRLMSPVKAMTQFPVLAAEALAGADRIFEMLDQEPDDVDPPDALTFPGLEREIVFDDVWYAYEPGRWALRGIDLTVGRGEVVAIVGPSGAGKSTLVDLLPRFIAPQRGAVLVDGVPLSTYSRRSIRQALGIVSQETVIFNDSVRANIAYAEPGATDAAVEAAARAANAHEFIVQLPDGYETQLGERGTRLSGGERQRIAIARVLLRDPPILILDEATSALDTESERLVQEAIARLLEHRTVLVIAHRLATVARADRIVVLDGGRLVEAGDHAKLVSAGGLYQRIHEFEQLTVNG